MKRKIAVVTTSRAEYGILKKLLTLIKNDSELELQLIVTGSHLMKEMGMTVNEIKSDGFAVAAEVDMKMEGDQPVNVANAMGNIVQGVAASIEKLQPDVVAVIADRFETCAAALAIVPFHVPIIHIAGGYITEGAIDDKLRHATTKMSHIHYAVDEHGRNNIINLGEEEWRIIQTGSMVVDLLESSATVQKETLEKQFNVNFSKGVMLFVYHPVTMEYQDTERQIKNAIAAIKTYPMDIIALLPNQDTSRLIITKELTAAAEQNNNIKLIKHMPRNVYASVMKHCTLMVGNSSSGILEAPTFQKAVVNIGNRQKGRIQAQNVINSSYETEEITEAINQVLSEKFKVQLKTVKNPFGDGKASERIYNHLKTMNIDEKLLQKKLASDAQ